MRFRRLVRLLLIASGLGALVCGALALHIYFYGQEDRAVPSDVIIILGAGTRPSGRPSISHTRRIRHGVALYQRGIAPFILCTGGFTDSHPSSEAQACADLAQELGVPRGAILVEEHSRSTEENAIETRKLMAARGLKTAVLVSDNYHLWRAEMIFRAQGINVSLSPAQATTGTLNWRTIFSNTLREVAATGWYVFKTALGLQITDVRL